jgi:hypothetical protein
VTVFVRVNETEVVVTPAVPAIPAEPYKLDVKDAMTAYSLSRGWPVDLQRKAALEAAIIATEAKDYKPERPAVPAVTKVEKTYDIVGLTASDLSAINEAMFQVYSASLRPNSFLPAGAGDFGYKHYNAGTFVPRKAVPYTKS